MDAARNSVVGELAILTKILRAAPDEVALCLTAPEVKSAIASNRLAVVLHLEGAEAIDPDLNFLHVLYAAGLRSLEPRQHLRPRRALPLSCRSGHWRRVDGGWRTADPHLQRHEDTDRPVAHQRQGVLGRRAIVDGAAGRDAFKRACAVPRLAESHRPPA